MSDNPLFRVCGVSALLATVLFLVANLGGQFMEVASGIDSFDPARALAASVVTPDVLVISAWLHIYGALLALVATIGIHTLLRDAGSRLLIPTAVMSLGLFVLTMAYLIALAMPYRLAPLYASGVAPETVLSAEVLRKILFELFVVYGSWLTLGVAPALFGLFGLRSRHAPRWVSWIALIGGAIGSVEWLKAYPWQAERTLLTVTGLALFGVWFVACGVLMLRMTRLDQPT